MEPAEKWYKEEYGNRSVILVVGWRQGRNQLAVGRLPIDGEAAAELRQGVNAELARLDSMVPIDPAGAPLAEPGEEFFYLQVEDLPDPLDVDGGENEPVADGIRARPPVSELLQLVETASEAEQLTVGQVRDGTFLFFAVVLPPDRPGDSVVAAVRLWNPRRGIKPGRMVTHFANRVTKLENPILIFDPEYDLIARGDDLGYFAQSAFDRLFKDLGTIERRVPVHIESLAKKVPLNRPSQEALEEACVRRISYAKRLERLVIGDQIPQFSMTELKEKLAEFGFNPDDFVADDELDFSADSAGIVLDYLEELYFRTLFSDAPRRADRFRDLRE